MEFDKFIKCLFRQKMRLYFISPHLDDAALSCGGLIEFLSENFQVTVISIFTEPPLPPFSISGKAYLKQCNVTDAEKLFMQRKLEDENALSKIGVNIKHLKYHDALWRKKDNPNLFEKLFGKFASDSIHVYPTYRWHVISGRISKFENNLIEKINQSLTKIIDKKKNHIVFCPAGIGNHVDHIITRECCLENFKNIILWSDFPYDKTEKSDFLNKNGYEEMIFYFDQNKKKKLIKSYKSQFKAMFPTGEINSFEEKYYFNKDFDLL